VTTRHLIIGSFLVALVLSPLTAKAADSSAPEFYGGLFGGATIPFSLQDLRQTDGTTITNLDLATSGIFGAKVGFFLPGRDRWMGVETEFFYTNPHIKQQEATVTDPVLGPQTGTITGSHVRVATWALNWIIRYPGERFQPYAGIGAGLFWGRVSGSVSGTGSDTSPGVNALAGVRLLLTQRFALFAEYKYNRVTFDFGGVTHALYQVNNVVGGLSFHF